MKSIEEANKEIEANVKEFKAKLDIAIAGEPAEINNIGNKLLSDFGKSYKNMEKLVLSASFLEQNVCNSWAIMSQVKEYLPSRLNTLDSRLMQKDTLAIKDYAKQIRAYYCALFQAEQNRFSIKPVINKEFIKEGFLVQYTGYTFMILKPFDLCLKNYCSDSGMITAFPLDLQKKIKCYLGLVCGKKMNPEAFYLLDSNFNPIDTFHSHEGKICTGNLEVDYLAMGSVIDSMRWDKITQEFKRIENLLETVNFSGAYYRSRWETDETDLDCLLHNLCLFARDEDLLQGDGQALYGRPDDSDGEGDESSELE